MQKDERIKDRIGIKAKRNKKKKKENQAQRHTLIHLPTIKNEKYEKTGRRGQGLRKESA